MICKKCGIEYDGKVDLCHRCRSIYLFVKEESVKVVEVKADSESTKAVSKTATRKK